ncbi:D-alanyl-D-alanine carboxypeptidase [Glaciihabitans sp. UYNi722]|uniref:D-alanyl-D-alanine carboxypeptidase family protein n=1 Tax=Glaciihabitans sp. UYNi722 TaxID=3156344 RepID=UPI00339B5569
MSIDDRRDEFAEFSAMLARGEAQATSRGSRPTLEVEPDGRIAPPMDAAAVARARRRRTRAGIATVVVVLMILAVVGTYIPLALSAPVDAATVHLQPVTAPKATAVALSLPQVGESAVSVAGAEDFEGTTGTNGILASSGGTAALPMASISKLITALVILDAKPLGEKDAGPNITFSKADHDLYDKYYVMDASIEPMSTGSVMSERDALATILVASACNYAEAMSTWAFGSQANFLSATRKWLSAHGMADTKLVEPTGVDARNVSTPTDLIAIGKLAMANPLVATIVGSQSASVANIGQISNTNDLLGIDGVNGIKTGTLDSSDLLFSARVDVGIPEPITVVGVVLGGDSRQSVNDAARALIASIQSGFQQIRLVGEGDVFGTYTTPWNDDATIVAGEHASALAWSNAAVTSTRTTRKVTTAKTGTKVGSVTFVAGKATVTVPLVLKGSITAPDAWWRLTHPAHLFDPR